MKPDPAITAIARPVRAAYLIEDGDGVHEWLDAAFSESLGRHGGRQSLMIPVVNGGIPPLYIDWLKVFDPDVVWLVTGTNEQFAKQFEQHCSPLRMESINRFPNEKEKRSPRFQMRDTALTALSWLPFLRIASGGFRPRPEAILDCYPAWQDDGLITDNFGTPYWAFNRFPVHRELADIVKPLMLTPSDAPKDRWRMRIEGDEILDPYESLEMLMKSGRLVTLAYLSNIQSKHLSVRSHRWTDSFCLIIGDSFVDRLACWNARLLFDDAQHQAYKTMRLPSTILKDDAKIERVKKFLNGSNWINPYGNQPQVTVRSSSMSEDQLKEFASKAGSKGSWCQYHVKAIESIEECCPKPDNERHSVWMPARRQDAELQMPLRHRTESVGVPRPFHLQHAASAHPMCSEGQWIAQYTVDRTADNNRFGNVRDAWWLPRRSQLTRAFIPNYEARITAGGALAVPVHKSIDRIEINEPTDEEFFRHLLHQPPAYTYPDIRHADRVDLPYQYSRPSDKGRYLQGVLGMFGSLHRAYDVLTHGFWRKQFARLGSPSEDQYPLIIKTLKKRFPPQAGKYTFDSQEKWERLARMFVSQAMNVRQPKYTIKLRTLQDEWKGDLERAIETDPHLKERKEKELGEANEELTRSLQSLCREGVFHQGYSWPCRHCAYKNWTAIDGLNIELECQVCHEKRELPIDLSFDFRMNEFLATCLREHDTLSVIWVLARLSRTPNAALIFAPQTEIFRKWPEDQGNVADREIDILCILEGKVVFGEAKASLAEIDKEEIDNLVALAGEFHPDVLVIGAMEGHPATLDAKVEEVKKRVAPNVEVRGLLGGKRDKLEFHLP